MSSQAEARPTAGASLTLGRLTALLLALALLALVAYWQPLPVALLLAGLLLTALAWARPFWVFAGLLAFLPFHDQLIRVLTWPLAWPAGRVTLVSLWKEGIILLLLAVTLVQHATGRRPWRVKIYQFDLWLAALVLLSAVYIVVANSMTIGAFGFRNYYEPLALLVLARLLPYSRRELKGLLIALAAVAAVVAAYGIFQAEFIDFPTMVSMGYVDEFGNLPYAFKTALQDYNPRPRAISTVTGPNQLAIYLNMFILLAAGVLAQLSSRSHRWSGQKVLLAGLVGLYGLCLLLTFSRGGLLALGVSLLAWAGVLVNERGIKRTWREVRGNRWFLVSLALLGAGTLAGLLISGFARRVWRGLTGQDPAALGHLTSMDQAAAFIGNHPLGIGLGMAGPRALSLFGQGQIEHTESTYLQFGMETGLVGMLLLLLLLLSLVATLWRLWHKRRAQGDVIGQTLTLVALVAWVGALAVFAVTPLMQNFLVASYLWLFAGFAFHLDAYSDDGEWADW